MARGSTARVGVNILDLCSSDPCGVWSLLAFCSNHAALLPPALWTCYGNILGSTTNITRPYLVGGSYEYRKYEGSMAAIDLFLFYSGSRILRESGVRHSQDRN